MPRSRRKPGGRRIGGHAVASAEPSGLHTRPTTISLERARSSGFESDRPHRRSLRVAALDRRVRPPARAPCRNAPLRRQSQPGLAVRFHPLRAPMRGLARPIQHGARDRDAPGRAAVIHGVGDLTASPCSDRDAARRAGLSNHRARRQVSGCRIQSRRRGRAAGNTVGSNRNDRR